MSFKVGEIVSKLRLDTTEWNKSIKQVKEDIAYLEKLAEKKNIAITLNIGMSAPEKK